MAYTISTHNGSAVRRAHNIRAESVMGKQPHIDPAGQHEIWIDETEVHAYHRLFDAAVADYNARQRRADRRIKNYHATVAKSAKKHTVYEMIISIGNKEHHPDPEVGREIMWQFVLDWQRRNPNLIIIGAYYHNDEEGAPHLHIDYIPVGHNYKRGPETQTGLVQALAEQGFTATSANRTAQIIWEARENQILEDLCRARGMEIVHPERDAPEGAKRRHERTDNYKQMQDAAKEQAQQQAQQIIQAAEQRAAAAGAAILTMQRESRLLQDEIDRRRAEADLLDTQIYRKQAESQKLDSQLSELKHETQAAEQRAEAAEQAAEAAERRKAAAEVDISALTADTATLEAGIAALAESLDENFNTPVFRAMTPTQAQSMRRMGIYQYEDFKIRWPDGRIEQAYSYNGKAERWFYADGIDSDLIKSGKCQLGVIDRRNVAPQSVIDGLLAIRDPALPMPAQVADFLERNAKIKAAAEIITANAKRRR